jgi:hypothetical protein
VLDYARLGRLTRHGDLSDGRPYERAVDALVALWLDDYTGRTPSRSIVETSCGGFAYLFDVGRGRLIAAWGVSRGRHAGARDRARMAGHPKGAGARYHRGHAIPHTLGGLTDINLVPQLGRINVGPFRELERLAVATPGALYFTYWKYGRSTATQRPEGVDQGLLRPGRPAEIRRHPN